MNLAQINSLPGVTAEPDAATQEFVYNHTMLRVKDIEKTLDFYTRVLGFSVLEVSRHPNGEFDLYFLGLIKGRSQIPDDPEERHLWRKRQSGLLELTYNYGTEKDPEFAYHNGNQEPRGYGHICLTVPDIRAACARFEELGVPFQKRLADGRMHDIAFLKDPDGYWVEIVQFTALD